MILNYSSLYSDCEAFLFSAGLSIFQMKKMTFKCIWIHITVMRSILRDIFDTTYIFVKYFFTNILKDNLFLFRYRLEFVFIIFWVGVNQYGVNFSLQVEFFFSFWGGGLGWTLSGIFVSWSVTPIFLINFNSNSSENKNSWFKSFVYLLEFDKHSECNDFR